MSSLNSPFHLPSDIIFAFTNFLIIPSVYFFFPETAYRSLEEIDEIFAKSGWLSVVHNSYPSVTPLRHIIGSDQLETTKEEALKHLTDDVVSKNDGSSLLVS